MTMEEHKDGEVRAAIIRLADALCQWERATGIENTVIIRMKDGYVFRAVNGKPNIPDDIPDAQLLKMMD